MGVDYSGIVLYGLEIGDDVSIDSLKEMITYLNLEEEIKDKIERLSYGSLEGYLEDCGLYEDIYEGWYDKKDDPIQMISVGGHYSGDPIYYLGIRETYHESPSYGIKKFTMPNIQYEYWNQLLNDACIIFKIEYKEPSWYVMVEVS